MKTVGSGTKYCLSRDEVIIVFIYPKRLITVTTDTHHRVHPAFTTYFEIIVPCSGWFPLWLFPRHIFQL
jgi:hypothetical protein